MKTRYIKNTIYGAVFVFLSFYVHNPFFDSCTFDECNYGNGLPLAFYFDKLCSRGNSSCITGYFSGATLVFDLIFMTLFFLTAGYFYRLFRGDSDDSETPMYNIRN